DYGKPIAQNHFKTSAPIDLDTDHKPLSHPDPSRRLTRWQVQLHIIDFEIDYRKGSKNGNADEMSRSLLKTSEKDEDIFEKEGEEDIDPGLVVNNIVPQEIELNETQMNG
ncbi:unnamed protein product, partial [Brachionus calyciflorus]